MNKYVNKNLSIKSIHTNVIHSGYTDSELESLTNPQEVNTGKAPWVYWTSELYSFGRLYREWAYYPKRLPLFIYSDHGVHKQSAFYPHEENNNAICNFS